MVASAPQLAGSLPIPRTRLIGREAEIASARSFLLNESVPLLTLTGPGGVGKTRLTLAIAHDVAPHFVDGVVWVDLAPLRDPALVPPAVADALAFPLAPGQSVMNALVQYLQQRHALLVLDNCEHLGPAVAALAAALLASCPALQILATGRAPLRLRGEQLFPVEPLPLPAPDITAHGVLAHNEAISLFVDRAQAVCPSFSLSATNAPSVATLCRYLEGLPLGHAVPVP